MKWASQVRKDRRLDASLEKAEELYCSWKILLFGPNGETILVDVSEHGRRMQVSGRKKSVTCAASVPWKFIEVARKADSVR